jgi:hypothetical protein
MRNPNYTCRDTLPCLPVTSQLAGTNKISPWMVPRPSSEQQQRSFFSLFLYLGSLFLFFQRNRGEGRHEEEIFTDSGSEEHFLTSRITANLSRNLESLNWSRMHRCMYPTKQRKQTNKRTIQTPPCPLHLLLVLYFGLSSLTLLLVNHTREPVLTLFCFFLQALLSTSFEMLSKREIWSAWISQGLPIRHSLCLQEQSLFWKKYALNVTVKPLWRIQHHWWKTSTSKAKRAVDRNQ